MNLSAAGAIAGTGGIPRVSGDEPLMGDFNQAKYMYSPRERG